MIDAPVFMRFDIVNDLPIEKVVLANPDGVCMFASEALAREDLHAAALQRLQGEYNDLADVAGELRKIITGCNAEITRLRALLAEREADKARLDSGCIMTNDYDEFGDKTITQRCGLDLRAAIDAAMEAAKK